MRLRQVSATNPILPLPWPGFCISEAHSNMSLLRSLFWLALFLVATFAFTVLFEHGPTNFAANAQKELDTLQRLYGAKLERKKDDSDKLGH